MNAVYVGTFEPGTPEWREHRADKIGGSDLAVILGLSKWQSAYSLWHERRGNVEHPPEKPQMTWGTLLEPVIVNHFQTQHPEFMVDYSPGQVWAHSDRPWQVVSPDALIGPNPTTIPPKIVTGLEAKTSRYDYDWIDGPPDYYDVQAQWAMDVFGVNTWHFAVLFSGSDYQEFTVEANPPVQEALREVASDFLDSLSEGRVPPVDGHDTTYLTIRQLHPDIDDEDVEAGEVGERYIQALRDLRAAEEAKTEAAAHLADYMGRARRALLNGQRIAYRRASKPGHPPYLTVVSGLLDKHPAAS